MLRKQILKESQPAIPEGAISIADAATVSVTSERPDHPIDCICDGRQGPGSTRWIAEESGDQSVILTFDEPRALKRVTLEIEEPDVSRTQELALSFSRDGGQHYREVVRQEYNFSPPGTTFERESWQVPVDGVTNLWIWIRPDKGGRPAYATLTSLVVE